MLQVTIPEDLLREIEQALPPSASAEEFVIDAVRQRLSWQEKKQEFYRLSDQTRRAMAEKGVSEAQILGEFESFREKASL
jgi:hypothetical protein